MTTTKAPKSHHGFKLPKLEKRVKAAKTPKTVEQPVATAPVPAAPTAPVAPVAPLAPAPVAQSAPPVATAAPTDAFAAPDQKGRGLSLRADLSVPSAPVLGLMALFVVAYVALAAWGMQLADTNGITPWYPAAGLALGVVAIGGVEWTVPTFVAAVLASLVDGAAPGVAVVLAIPTAAAYSAAGVQLSRVIDLRHPLTRVTDAWWLIGVGVVGAPVVVANLVVGYFSFVAGDGAAHFGSMVRTFVLGDALGVSCVTPAVLLAFAGFRRAGGLRGIVPANRDFLSPEAIAAIVGLIALTPAVYLGAGQDLRAVAALPLCWLALRFGISGAVVGGLTWSVSSALLLSVVAPSTDFVGLQAFLLTGTMLAVIIGAVVTDREHTQRELHHFATHDQASGLPNERRLIEMISESVADARGRDVTLLIIRFAGLRQVSAALRKENTEELVGILAARLAAIAGPTAKIARPGFDRFAVLGTGADGARRQAIAARLIEELKAPIAVDSREVFVDPRIGVTVALPGEAPDVVLTHGDHAADVTSGSDGNRIGYYDSSIERAHRERVELTEDLRLAVLRGEFLLAFQPIVTAKEGRVVAAEALLRWVDKKRGPVSPMDFIPVAEETGLILPIGRWVLNEACTRAAAWPHVAGRPIDVSVNVSPIQLMDEGFVQDVADALNRSHLAPNRLRIEITEGIVVEDIEMTILRINQLREMGVETMLDDFGTGHSSLAWVQRLPVSCIKIDRAFVNDIAVDGIDRAIVHASLYLSRALGTETVAEGVETEAQREQLVRMGCQKLQGYLFARPQPADVFPDWLAKQRAQAQVVTPPRAAAPTASAGPRPISGGQAAVARVAGVAAAPMPGSAQPILAQPAPVEYAAAPVAHTAPQPAYAAAPPAPTYAAPQPEYAAAPVAPAPPVAPHGLQAVPEDPRYAA